MTEYSGQERRRHICLRDEDIDRIAEKVEARLRERFYTEVGRGVVRKSLWVLGAVVVLLTSWLLGSGHLRL